MSARPSSRKCIQLMKEAGCDADVIKHCTVVSVLAVKIARRIKGADVGLVRCGALLHDLGRARTHGMDHAITGAAIAKELGLPEDLIGIIRNHIGAGLSAAEARAAGLPPVDYIPETLEQKIVAHADNLVDYFDPVPVANILQSLTARGHNQGAERIRRLHTELSRLAGMDIDEIVLKMKIK